MAASPVYNRYFWNFTQGDGEVAYALSYNISDQNSDGFIDEFDARIMYPQGHGDAWGHYLTASKIYYQLLRHPFYSWHPRPEAVPVAGVRAQIRSGGGGARPGRRRDRRSHLPRGICRRSGRSMARV